MCVFKGALGQTHLGPADFMQKTPTTPVQASDMCLFPTPICAAAQFDTFHFTLVIWASLQLTWTCIVLAGQAYQVTRQLTTYELSNLGRYGYMGGRGAQNLGSQANHPATRLAEELPSGHRDSCQHHGGHKHKRKAALVSKIVPAGLLTILGLDLYTKGKAAEGIQLASSSESKGSNPFDFGVWRNCTDFWTRGRTLGVEYTSVRWHRFFFACSFRLAVQRAGRRLHGGNTKEGRREGEWAEAGGSVRDAVVRGGVTSCRKFEIYQHAEKCCP
jgi:hypothetical protein